MAITQKGLAKMLGVSEMAVSRALRGCDGVSDALRSKVLRIAEQHDMAVQAVWQRPAPRLNVVCTVLSSPALMDESGFHGRILKGLHLGMRKRHGEVINVPGINGSWPLVARRNHVDGLIFVSGDDAPLPDTDCPVAAVGIFREESPFDLITVDNFRGGRQAGEYLARMGHRRAVFIGLDTLLAHERLAGLRMALEASGGGVAHVRLLKGLGMAEWPARCVDEVLGAGSLPDFTAIVFYNDYMAAFGMLRLAERGVRVPDDISVVGFDGAPPAFHSGPALATCAIPLENIGAEAVRMLYWRLDDPEAPRRKLVLQGEFVEGETVVSVDGSSAGGWRSGRRKAKARTSLSDA